MIDKTCGLPAGRTLAYGTIPVPDQSAELVIVFTFRASMRKGFNSIFGSVCIRDDRRFVLLQRILGAFECDEVLNKSRSYIVYSFEFQCQTAISAYLEAVICFTNLVYGQLIQAVGHSQSSEILTQWHQLMNINTSSHNTMAPHSECQHNQILHSSHLPITDLFHSLDGVCFGQVLVLL